MSKKPNGKAKSVRGNGRTGADPGRASTGERAVAGRARKAAGVADVQAAKPQRLAGLGKAEPVPSKGKGKPSEAQPHGDDQRHAGERQNAEDGSRKAGPDEKGAQTAPRRPGFASLTGEGQDATERMGRAETAIGQAEQAWVLRGKPTKFTWKRWALILQRQAMGTFLSVICREARADDPDFPDADTIRDWANNGVPAELKNGATAVRLTTDLLRAREEGTWSILNDTAKIADGKEADYINTPFGITVDRTAIARAKLQVETRFKILRVLDPGTFGDKLELAGNAERPVGTRANLSDLSEDELIAAYEAAQRRRGEK